MDAKFENHKSKFEKIEPTRSSHPVEFSKRHCGPWEITQNHGIALDTRHLIKPLGLTILFLCYFNQYLR